MRALALLTVDRVFDGSAGLTRGLAARAALESRAVSFFFYKPQTAYDIGWCDWSSDVCSSDLDLEAQQQALHSLEQRVVQVPRDPLALVEPFAQEIGRASCREKCTIQCRSR